jgi:hypothetical protein
MDDASGMPRTLEPEWLDELPADDPRAQHSRRDLRRLHRAMATLSIEMRALDRACAGSPPRGILELGAGDGSLMLRLAQRRAARWPGVQLSLLDRVDLVEGKTFDSFLELGWTPNVLAMDVFDWLQISTIARWDVVVANLFLHHFSDAQLTSLLAGIAARSRVFFCCEPRRGSVPLAASHLVGALGAGEVTRQDAVLSVRAGFRGKELSALWPADAGWQTREYRAGLFSHAFLATRRSQTP